MKYSDQLIDWLVELGYSHCFCVAGGNIMHLLESASRKLTCVAFVHEVAAGIAAEYFNEVSPGKRAFALVTAGPGLTNIVTAMAGAYLESRELLVIGGQVKTSDLSRGKLRQRGIQEVDGVAIARPLCVESVLMDEPFDHSTFARVATAGGVGRKGPVFIEIPLDIQGRDIDPVAINRKPVATVRGPQAPTESDMKQLAARLRRSERPILLLGGGVSRDAAASVGDSLIRLGVPVMTTWNGADRIAEDHPLYFGRPNTWGQRYANLLIQQSDLIIALGTRLSLQQTGFNWQEFAPQADIVQVDCDQAELEKGHPRIAWGLCCDAGQVLRHFAVSASDGHADWVAFCREVKAALPPSESSNVTRQGYLSPYEFALDLSDLCDGNDIVIPCSSGGAFTVMMQTFRQKFGQRMVTNKGLAAMGYGLSGAIGAAFATQGRRTILVEGDGGLAQNLQEIGTAVLNRLNLKMFIFENNGYASIRMTQSNYFNGRYVCCDEATGLALPDWEALCAAYRVPTLRLYPGFAEEQGFRDLFAAPGMAAFLVKVDPEQTYFPKISSRVTASGNMESNPLHLMSPPLDDDTMKRLGRYLKN